MIKEVSASFANVSACWRCSFLLASLIMVLCMVCSKAFCSSGLSLILPQPRKPRSISLNSVFSKSTVTLFKEACGTLMVMVLLESSIWIEEVVN